MKEEQTFLEGLLEMEDNMAEDDWNEIIGDCFFQVKKFIETAKVIASFSTFEVPIFEVPIPEVLKKGLEDIMDLCSDIVRFDKGVLNEKIPVESNHNESILNFEIYDPEGCYIN